VPRIISCVDPLALGLRYRIGITHYEMEDAMLELALIVSISILAALDFLNVGSDADGPQSLQHE